MYPIQCPGKYSVPALKGKARIKGVIAAVKTTSSAARLTLIDDESLTAADETGMILNSTQRDERTVQIAEFKGLANVDGNIGAMFPVAIPIRHGISVYAENLEPGKIAVYRE